MNSAAIKALHDSGLTVRVSHQRPVKGETPNKLITRYELDVKNLHAWERKTWEEKRTWEEKGGRTQVRIYKGSILLGVGEAVCSKKDNFCRKVGLELALPRAMANALSLSEI